MNEIVYLRDRRVHRADDRRNPRHGVRSECYFAPSHTRHSPGGGQRDGARRRGLHDGDFRDVPSLLYFGNIDRRLFWRLVIPGVIGAVIGAYVLSKIPGERFKSVIAVYLLGMGVLMVVRVFKTVPPLSVKTYLTPLGFFGAFIDAIGGGLWLRHWEPMPANEFRTARSCYWSVFWSSD